MIEAAVGLTLGAVCVAFARFIRGERWFYTLSLLTLPSFYAAFAICAGRGDVATLELAWGAPYLIAGVLLTLINLHISALLVGALWLTHGAYDLLHSLLVENPGVPSWYPVFCATVDFVVGSYLLATSRRAPTLSRRNVPT